MYNLIFYNFYLYVKFCKRVFNTSLYRDLKIGSILIISLLECLNLIVICKFFDFKFAMNLSSTILLLPIFAINYLIFGVNNNFASIIKEIEKRPSEQLQSWKIVTLIYSVISLLAICLI